MLTSLIKILATKFDSSAGQRLVNNLFGAFAAIALPLFLFYSYSLDDVQAFSAIQSRSYFELAFGSHGWGGTAFYRPLIDLQTKLIWDVFSGSFFAFKLYQFFLFSIFLIAIRKLVMQLRLNLLGTCMLLAMAVSSRAIHDAFLWWVNMGQAIVLISFAWLLIFLCSSYIDRSSFIAKSTPWQAFVYAGISFLALFSKEIGLVVLIGFLYLAYVQRNKFAIGLLLLVFAGFIFARIFVIGVLDAGTDGFMASSGLGFSYLSSGELRNEFGGNKYLYYLYNVVTQFLYALFRQPVDGQFMTYTFGVRGAATMIYIISSGYLLALLLFGEISMRRDLLVFLLGAIIINSMLSFPYARERIMIAADLAVAILFSLITTAISTSFSAENNKPRLSVFLGFGVLAAILMIALTLLRAIRRYIIDFSNSAEAMGAFVNKDYRLITETDGPLPSMVMQNVIDGLTIHYQLILKLVSYLTSGIN